MTIQRQFDLQVSAGRPLMSVWAVVGVLDRSEDDVLNLVECGWLRWAWDIRGKGAEKATLRISAQSVVDYSNNTQRFHRALPTESRRTRIDLETVVQNLLPHSRPDFRATEIMKLLNCSSQHVQNLIADRLLIPSLVQDPRPRGSKLLTRLSVTQFLIRRAFPEL